MSFNTMNTQTTTSTKIFDEGLRQYMIGIYNNVGIGLMITALVAFVVSKVPDVAMFLASGVGAIIMLVGLLAFMFIGFNPSKIHNKSVAQLRMTFYGFSAFLGAFYSIYMLMYTGEALARVFVVTSVMFLSASLYGYVTKRSLMGFRSFLMMGVWGIVIASLVNLFMGSAMIHYLISWAGVIIFTGMTAFDTQNIKRTYLQYGDSEIAQKLGILGAMNLYYNFVLLFQFLLNLMNQR